MVVVVLVFILPRLEPARRVAAVSVALVVLVITLQIPGVASLILTRTDTALATGGAGRTDIWTVGLGIFGSAPWTGVGLANFSIANTPERVRDIAVTTGTAETLANLRAHNIVISTLGELGLVGIVMLAVFLLPLIVRRGWGPDAPLVQTALGSLMVMAFFLDLLERKEVWFLIGMACGLAYLRGHADARQAIQARAARIRARRGAVRATSPG
jgi:O-antigen ligase